MSDTSRPTLSRSPVTGTFLTISHPTIAEILAIAGADFLAVDCEHTGFDHSELRQVILAADAHQTPVVVRVAPGQTHQATLALNAGAVGVIFSRVSSEEEGARAVEAVRFPPLGNRGLAPSRATGFGAQMNSYVQGANQSLVVAAHIGTIGGLLHLDAIAALPGIDLLFVGPSDIRAAIATHNPSMGFDEAMELAVQAAKRHGKRVGTFASTPQEASDWRSRGFDFIVLASDGLLLSQAARQAFTR